MEWKWFVAGLLAGWLIEWVIDWVYWRKRAVGVGEAREALPATGRGGEGGLAAASPKADDLTRIEGIGPKIAAVLAASRISTFRSLADTPTSELARILDAAGPDFRLADPGTWAEQAALAVKGDWKALDALQAELRGGMRPSDKSDPG